MNQIIHYNAWLSDISIQSPTIDWNVDTFKIALLSDAYVPSIAEDAVWDHISQYEITPCAEYAADGTVLANTAETVEDNIKTITGDNVVWQANVDGFDAARYAVLYKANGESEEQLLIGFIDLNRNRSNKKASVRLVWNPLGILRFILS